jgi:diadenosine tetraphosphatase ApaH/serine/threonine PP2A family protein phosphatase
MKTAVLYDIHGNLPALEAVVGEIRRLPIEQIIVGGDVVPGPMPWESLVTLMALDVPVRFLRGNGETAVLAEAAGVDSGVPEPAREAVRWTADQMPPGHERLLADWPQTLRWEVQGTGEVLFCHATPRSETEMFTSQTSEDVLLPVFEGLEVGWVVCGHTHMQFDRCVGRTRVVNAGSVGMPFGRSGAHWLLLGDAVDFRHTPYDLDEAAARIERTAYPQAEHFARNHVLRCPTELEMLAVFAKAELR